MKQNKMLIVDDEKINTLILRNLFLEDYDISIAYNGKEALDLIESKDSFDIILLDIIMPVIPGLEFLKSLRNKIPDYQAPIIVISSDNKLEDQKLAYSLGVTDFIFKPFDNNVVVHRVYNAVLAYKRLIEVKENTTEIEKYTNIDANVHSITYFKNNFFETLKKATRTPTIIKFDLNNFKLINDFYGYSYGDELLNNIGLYMVLDNKEFILDSARIPNTDIFYVLVDYPLEYLEHFHFNKLEKLITKYQSLKINYSFGVYVIKNSKESFETIDKKVCIAHKMAKQDPGRTVVFYDDKTDEKINKQHRLINAFSDALKNEEFVVYYQPVVALELNKVVSCEALVRWDSKEYGMIQPNDFIPLFEKNGFIIELDHYVWNKTCFELSERLKKTGECVPISVNISRTDFIRENLVEELNEILAKYNLDHKYIRVEITESAFQEKTDQLIKLLNEFKENNYLVLMDDFGTGYSSLENLDDMPIDIVKLDMKFIRDLSAKSKKFYIISSILRMCKLMQIKVIAEGVETEEQREFLMSIGCEYGQGYYYSKPLPIDGFHQFIEGKRIFEDYNFESENHDINLNEIWDIETNFSKHYDKMVNTLGVYEYVPGEGLSISKVNRAYLDLIGFRSDSNLEDSINLFKTTYEENKSLFDEHLKVAKKTRRNESFRIIGKRLDNKEFSALITIRYIGCIGNRDEYVFSLSDISSEVKLLEKLESNYKVFDSLDCEICTFELSENSVKVISETRQIKALDFIEFNKDCSNYVNQSDLLNVQVVLNNRLTKQSKASDNVLIRVNAPNGNIIHLYTVIYDVEQNNGAYIVKTVLIDVSHLMKNYHIILNKLPLSLACYDTVINAVTFKNESYNKLNLNLNNHEVNELIKKHKNDLEFDEIIHSKEVSITKIEVEINNNLCFLLCIK